MAAVERLPALHYGVDFSFSSLVQSFKNIYEYLSLVSVKQNTTAETQSLTTF